MHYIGTLCLCRLLCLLLCQWLFCPTTTVDCILHARSKASGGASIKSKLKADRPNRDEQAATTQATSNKENVLDPLRSGSKNYTAQRKPN